MTALDLFIHHPKEPGHLFNVTTEVVKGHIVFVITELVWQDAEQENKETKVGDKSPIAFAVWWDDKHNKGWRAQS